ncbi:MAG: cell envelope integrity protein CreD [Litorilituus sp.]|jgi:inner membrane protein|nr:cell envelope integrity protein CreD [Litorilituus sp.]
MQKQLAVKLGLIGFIASLLMIPLGMISGKITERASFLNEAKRSVSNSWTASQNVMGALLVIPYEVHSEITVTDSKTNERRQQLSKTLHHKFISPEKLRINTDITNSVRHKGIYTVPVYTANINVGGSINVQKLSNELKKIKASGDNVVITTPYFSITLSDPRGINSIPVLQWQKQKLAFNPGSKLKENTNGLHANLPHIHKLTDNKKLTDLNFSYQIELRGMEQLSFVPVGIETKINAVSTWPHPQFIGSFLPTSSQITSEGYKADWKVTSFASNIIDKIERCESGKCEALFKGNIGIKHIETVDIYLQSERTVKYGMLFIGLSFTTFFIFEILMKLPIHPIQYALVGFANAIFYLLLISLSENISFGVAYLVASVSCSGLLLFYLKPILKETKYAYYFSTVLAILYGVLYIIISMEDLALMMGSFLTFVALAIVMFSTRKINWYEVGDELTVKTKIIDQNTQE